MTKLSIYPTLEKLKQSEFKYGENDCCTMANEMCILKAGKDLIGELKNEYHDVRSAVKMLRKNHITVSSVLDEHFKRIPYTYCTDGDLVMVNSPKGKMMTIKVHGGVWCLLKKGATLIKPENIVACWEIK